LQAAGHHAGAGLEMPQHMIQRLGPAQDVVREVEQRRVGKPRDGRFFGRRAQQRHIAMARLRQAQARLRDHLGALLDAHHLPVRAHRLQQRRQAQAGAAADVEHRLTRLQAQPGDGQPAQGLEDRQLQVVGGGAVPVLLQRRLAFRAGTGRRGGWVQGFPRQQRRHLTPGGRH